MVSFLKKFIRSVYDCSYIRWVLQWLDRFFAEYGSRDYTPEDSSFLCRFIMLYLRILDFVLKPLLHIVLLAVFLTSVLRLFLECFIVFRDLFFFIREVFYAFS